MRSLRILGTNPDHAARWIDVISAQTAEFLAPQSSIISEAQHDAVADRFLHGGRENSLPIFFVRNPGHFTDATDKCTRSVVSHRILLADSLFD